MPVDPGNLLVLGAARRQARHRRAGLRAQPQGERLRLGARPADRGARRDVERYCRHGRRRPADGNPDAAAAARDRRRRACRDRCPRRRCSPPAAPAAWAGRTSCWRCSTASRWSAESAERALASRRGRRHCRHRPSGGTHPRGAGRPRRAVRPQSGLCRRPVRFAEGRHRRRAAGGRGRAGRARRHAGDFARPTSTG